MSQRRREEEGSALFMYLPQFLLDADLTLLLTLNGKGRYLGDMSLMRLSHH